MDGIIALGLLLILPLAIASGGPYLLRPISQRLKDKRRASFSLIDLAAFIWLLSLLSALLRAMYAYFALVGGRNSARLHSNLEFTYWFIATMLGLILVGIWTTGVRDLTAHQIRNWKARASYLCLAVPLAYLCPGCALISMIILISLRQLAGGWVWLLILLSIFTGFISRTISQRAMQTAASQAGDSETTQADMPADPFSES
jgi:hypothetical protein